MTISLDAKKERKRDAKSVFLTKFSARLTDIWKIFDDL
jgi:hypothetical protein